MNVEHQTLAVAVARQLDGVKGDSEAQNFLLRQQQRERSQYSPSSMQVARPEVDSSPVVNTIEGGTTPETLERELTKYLIKSGHRTLVVEEDKKYQDVNVADYIFSDLDFDGIEFRPGVYRTIVELYRKEWERLGVGVEVPTHLFINHHDPAVSRVAVDLLTADDNYTISDIWRQKEVHIESEEEQLTEGVPKAVMLYKSRVVEIQAAELMSRLHSPDLSEEEMANIMSALARLQTVRVEISKRTKRPI
jgi:DNA primase